MMKKMISLILAAVMMMSVACGAFAAAEAVEYQFRAEKTKAAGLTSAEWMASADSRALLVLLMGLDLELQEIGFDSLCILNETVYASMSRDGMLTISYDTGADSTYLIIYNPRNGHVVCEYVPDCDATVMKYTFERMGADYFQVHYDQLMYVVENYESVLMSLMRY